MSWATTSDVLAITKITVTEADVIAAQFLIEMFAETSEESSDAGLISSKNLRLLKLAVAYQAAWMTQHPDAFVTLDVRSVTTDGMSWTVDNPQAGVLAPNAKMAIQRLSWKRNRSIWIRKPGASSRRPSNQGDPYNAELDDYTDGWKPLEI